MGPSGRRFAPPPGRFWRISEEKLRELDSQGRIWWGPNGDARPSIKRYLSEVGDLVPRTLWKKEDVGSNRTSKNEMRELFPESESFDTPKPTRLIERMLRLATTTSENDVILDFFAGSGTTAHAVLELNKNDSGNRRFVLVQLPEPTGLQELRTIAEITKERLRRVGKRYRDQSPMFAGDLGFRVFKLDSTNIRAWDPDRDDLTGTLLDSIEHLKPDRSEQDILFELLLKLGLELTVPIEQRTIAGKAVHSIGVGSLMVCLAPKIRREEVEPLAHGIVSWREELKPAGETQVVLRDSAFADDVAKSNLTAILRQYGLENVRSL
jgi:adenine-specific DNA-methyltransferase